MKNYFLFLPLLISLSSFSGTLENVLLYPTLIDEYFIVEFELDNTDTISLSVFSIAGVLSKTILSDEVFQAGSYKIESSLLGLTNGTYTMKLESTTTSVSEQIIYNVADNPSITSDYLLIDYTPTQCTVKDLFIVNAYKDVLELRFTLTKADTLKFTMYNRWGMQIDTHLENVFLKTGYYRISCQPTVNDAIPEQETYIYSFAIGDEKKQGNIIKLESDSSFEKNGSFRINRSATVQVFDTTQITVYDTVTVLVIDQADCLNPLSVSEAYVLNEENDAVIVDEVFTISDIDADYMKLFTVHGQQIQQLPCNDTEISVAHLASGIYYAVFYKANQQTIILKLVKNQ